MRAASSTRLLDLVRGHADILQPERHVFAHRHVRIERVVLEHHGDIALAGGRLFASLAADRQRSGIDGLQTRDHAQERRFAGAGRSEKHDEFARFHRQGNVGKDLHAAETLRNVIELDARHASLPDLLLHLFGYGPEVKVLMRNPARGTAFRGAGATVRAGRKGRVRSRGCGTGPDCRHCLTPPRNPSRRWRGRRH